MAQGKQIETVIKEALESWRERNDEKAIRGRIFKLLSDARDKLILELVGLTTGSFGSIGLSSRHRESLAKQVFSEHAEDAAREWLEENLMTFPDLTKTDLRELEAYYRRAVSDAVKEQVAEQIDAAAGKIAERLVAEYLEEHGQPTLKSRLMPKRQGRWDW